MMKSKREQELEEEIKRLKKENETLKKTLKLQSKQMKQKDEILEDLLKENKTIFYKNKYELQKEENENLKAQLQEKEDYIAKIRGQLEKNSSNSSKPSSTDGFRKPIKSGREKSRKKQGAQEGHEYHGAELASNPTEIVKLPKQRKCSCGGKIKYNRNIIRRQLVDILTKYYVIEYQGQVGKCEKCGRIYNPKFPEGINNKVNYGNSTKGLSLMLGEYANVPVKKIKTLVGVLTDTRGPSSGAIMKWKTKSYKRMKPIRETIKEEMLKEKIIYHDETPYKLNGRQKYAIGAFTDNYSVIECNGGREKEAFEKMNILQRYGGTLMGDHYAVNESFQGQNAYCNIHTIRTAKGVLEVRKDSLAKEYIEFMCKLKEEVEKSPQNKLSKKRYKEVEREYKKLLKRWREQFNKFVKGKKRKYYDEERKLINLLLEYVEGHLLFAKEDYVGFTNNPAERRTKTSENKDESHR